MLHCHIDQLMKASLLVAMTTTVLAGGNQVVKTPFAPLGPGGAAQGIVDARGNLYTSMQYGVDVVTGKLVAGGAAAQMKQAMANVAEVFKAVASINSLGTSGTSCWIYGFDAATFGNISSEYYTFFTNKDHPSRNPTGATLVYDDALVGVSCTGFPNGGVRVKPPNFFPTDFNAQGLLVDGGTHLFTSAQLGLNPVTGSLAAGGAVNETHQALSNIAVVFATAFPKLGAKAFAQRASECQIILADDDTSVWPAVAREFASFFPPGSPSTPAISITGFPPNSLPLPAHAAVTCNGVGPGAARSVLSDGSVVARVGTTTQLQATAKLGSDVGTAFTATASAFAEAFVYLSKAGEFPEAIVQKTATQCQLWLADPKADAAKALAALTVLFANSVPALTVTKAALPALLGVDDATTTGMLVALQCFGSDTQ